MRATSERENPLRISGTDFNQVLHKYILMKYIYSCMYVCMMGGTGVLKLGPCETFLKTTFSL